MRHHYFCGRPFGYGDQSTLFGHNHAIRCHGFQRHGHRRHGYGPHAHGPHGHRPHGHGPHGHGPHGHGPHGHGPHGHGPHGHGPHDNTLYGHGPHGDVSYCNKPHGVRPHQGNHTCRPKHFWKSINHPKRLIIGGPHQCLRSQHEARKQGSNRRGDAILHNITLRPHSV